MAADEHPHASKVVLVHGRAAAMEIPGLMEASLGAALRYGLRRVGYGHWSCVPIDVPFFGGLWRPDEYLPVPVFDSGRRSALEGLGLPPLGHYVEWALEFADRFHDFSGDVLRYLLTDVMEYVRHQELRDATDQIVKDACRGADEAVMVGFSMGSMVGYNVLAHATPSFNAKAFVSCGSPIGSRSFHEALTSIAPNGQATFPECVRMWANIWNDDDPATEVHELTGLFPSQDDRIVQTARSYGRPPKPLDPAAAHNFLDYLSSKTLGAAVATALLAAGDR